MFLNTKGCQDGDYRYFVHYFGGGSNPVNFTYVLNQCNKKKYERHSSINKPKDKVTCLTLTMKNGRVKATNFN